MNMMVGLLFLVVVVTLMAAPVHAAGVAKGYGVNPDLPAWAYLGVPLGLLAGVAAVVLPMRAGARSLNETEF